MRLWEAALLGLVEGLTEYVPVSSTGHLILVAAVLGRGHDPAIKTFEIAIQAGAILAVLGLYRRRVASMAAGILGRDREGLRLLGHLALAVAPAVAVGLPLGETIKRRLFSGGPVAAALAAGGVAMLASEPLRRRRARNGTGLERLDARRALLIGAAQCLALWPGTSRSLVTILGGLAVGLHPAAAAEFSFLLALPTLGGATLLDLVRSGGTMARTVGPAAFATGLAVSFASAALAIRGLVAWLSHRGLALFGLYRLALAALVAIVLFR
ncbi:MAG: undecaprenyl-diphosphate phosphatase [Acidobacteria bacterium]|nr:MAG: undecaprenyl-diphosphate phosphatase [Acidobacteriota bacterium]